MFFFFLFGCLERRKRIKSERRAGKVKVPHRTHPRLISFQFTEILRRYFCCLRIRRGGPRRRSWYQGRRKAKNHEGVSNECSTDSAGLISRRERKRTKKWGFLLWKDYKKSFQNVVGSQKKWVETELFLYSLALLVLLRLVSLENPPCLAHTKNCPIKLITSSILKRGKNAANNDVRKIDKISNSHFNFLSNRLVLMCFAETFMCHRMKGWERVLLWHHQQNTARAEEE